jgi:hypothetical protein
MEGGEFDGDVQLAMVWLYHGTDVVVSAQGGKKEPGGGGGGGQLPEGFTVFMN